MTRLLDTLLSRETRLGTKPPPLSHFHIITVVSLLIQTECAQGHQKRGSVLIAIWPGPGSPTWGFSCQGALPSQCVLPPPILRQPRSIQVPFSRLLLRLRSITRKIEPGSERKGHRIFLEIYDLDGSRSAQKSPHLQAIVSVAVICDSERASRAGRTWLRSHQPRTSSFHGGRR